MWGRADFLRLASRIGDDERSVDAKIWAPLPGGCAGSIWENEFSFAGAMTILCPVATASHSLRIPRSPYKHTTSAGTPYSGAENKDRSVINRLGVTMMGVGLCLVLLSCPVWVVQKKKFTNRHEAHRALQQTQTPMQSTPLPDER